MIPEHSICGYNWGKGGDNSVNINVCQVNNKKNTFT